MHCLGNAYYLNLHAIPLQLSIRASSISKSILAATQQMNTSDNMCLGNPVEQHYNSVCGMRAQEERTKFPFSQEKEKCSSLFCILLHGHGRNVKASQLHPLSQKLGENSWL